MKSAGFWSRFSGFGWMAILVAGASLGCASKPEASATAPLPATNEVQGWTKSGETRVFPADKLYEYIDGDVDRYLQAGVQKTFTSDYRYGEKVEGVADIYVMSAPEGARKILESESSADSQSVALGDAGRQSKGSVTFRRGRYFVRLVSYQDAPEVAGALLALAHGIEAKLHD